MSNDYYDHGTFPAQGAKLSSAGMRSELDAIESGFDKLPALTGNAGKAVRVAEDGSRLEAMPTVSQAEAEAGVAETIASWSAQRVRQAVAAWYLTITSIAGVKVWRGNASEAGSVAIGDGALAGMLTGSTDKTFNLVLGKDAAAAATSGKEMTVLGARALAGQAAPYGNGWVVLGFEAGYNAVGDSAPTSGGCVLIGRRAGYLGAGSGSVCIGHAAAETTRPGVGATLLGAGAKTDATGNSDATAVGFTAIAALSSTAVGSGSWAKNYGTAIGAGAATGSGAYNVVLGYSAGNSLSSGLYNTYVGPHAGSTQTTGSGNVIIGGMNSSGVYAPANALQDQNNRVSVGSTSVTHAYVQTAWTVVSDLRDKVVLGQVPHGLEFVKKLRAIAFQYKETREGADVCGPVRYGYGAQDILALEGDSPVVVDTEDPDKLRFTSDSLVPILGNAIVDLSQQLDALKAEIAQLRSA